MKTVSNRNGLNYSVTLPNNNVTGPLSGTSTDNAMVRWNGTTGVSIQDTPGFIVDDSWNTTIGDLTTDEDRKIHLYGTRDITFFGESNTDGASGSDNAIIVQTQTANNSYASMGFKNDGALQIQTASSNGSDTSIIFQTDGSYINPGTNVIPQPTNLKTAMTIDGLTQNVSINTNLLVDNISEFTSNAGVTIEGTQFIDSGINLEQLPSNPGGPNTIWMNQSGELINGSDPIGGSDITLPGSSTDNAVVRWNGITGDTLQDTSGFTCDDNFNVKVGNSTQDVDRKFHIQGMRDVILFLEADTDNNPGDGELDNPALIMSQDGGTQAFIMGLTVGSNVSFASATSGTSQGFVFSTGGIYAPPGIGNPPGNISGNKLALQIDGSNQNVTIFETLLVDTINEYTLDAGVTIEGTLFENNGIDLTSVAANPGGVNTIWKSSVTSGLYDNNKPFVKSQGASANNHIVVFSNDTNGLEVKDTVEAVIHSGNNGAISIGSVNSIGSYSVALGGSTNNQAGCVYIGPSSGKFNTGESNVFVGSQICDVLASDGINNVIIGQGSCQGMSGTSSSNVVIGQNSWLNNVTANNCILIGKDVNPVNSNEIRIGNNTTSTCFIEGIQGNMMPNTISSHAVGIDTNNQLTMGLMPIGEVSYEDFNATSFVHLTPVVNTFYEITPVMTLSTNQSAKFSIPANGRIQYNGSFTTYFHIAVSICSRPESSNDIFAFQLHKNGIKIPRSQNRQKYGNFTDWNNSAQHNIVEMTTGDYISVFAANNSGTTGLTIGNLNIVLVLA